MNQTSSGPITGTLKARYKVISTILGETYDAPKGVDIFIDFNTFVKSLSTYQKYLSYLPFAGSEVEVDLMSSFLTTLNHWKNFSRKWENVRIIGIMNGFELPKLAERKVLKSYLVPHENKFKSDKYTQFVYYMSEAVRKVQAILKYVPNMYLITATEFDSIVIPNVLDDYAKSGRNRIIISGNPLMTGYHMMPNTKVIFTKFRRSGSQQIADPLQIVQAISKVDEDTIVSEFIENKVFYNLLNVIVGDFDRGILGLTQVGITTFAYNLLRGVEQGKIRKDPKSVESVLPIIDTVYHDYVKTNYPLVDIESHTSMVPQSAIQNMKSDMIDLVDIDGLQKFSIDGLNLLELL
jgi:hypothetical protein